MKSLNCEVDLWYAMQTLLTSEQISLYQLFFLNAQVCLDFQVTKEKMSTKIVYTKCINSYTVKYRLYFHTV